MLDPEAERSVFADWFLKFKGEQTPCSEIVEYMKKRNCEVTVSQIDVILGQSELYLKIGKCCCFVTYFQ